MLRQILLLLVLCLFLCGCAGRAVTIEGEWSVSSWEQPERELNLDAPPIEARILRGNSHAHNFVIRRQEDWEAIWKALKRPVPAVDFQTHMIVGACRMISGSELVDFSIDRVETRKGSLVAHVRLFVPKNLLIPTFWGELYRYVMIKRSPLPVAFAEEIRYAVFD